MGQFVSFVLCHQHDATWILLCVWGAFKKLSNFYMTFVFPENISVQLFECVFNIKHVNKYKERKIIAVAQTNELKNHHHDIMSNFAVESVSPN